MIRAQSRVITSSALVLYGTGDPAIDTPAMTAAFADSASRGVPCKLIGRFQIRISQDTWHDWNPGDPVYGGVPLVSNLTLDLTEATLEVERAAWMANTTRHAWLYTPGFSTTHGAYSNIEIIGGTFDFNRTGVLATPANSYGLGLISADYLTMRGTKFVSETNEKRCRGLFMRNCRWPVFLDLDFKWLSQGFWAAFCDYGYMRGSRLYEYTEGFDFDQPARGWIIKDTRGNKLPVGDPEATNNEQLFDLASMSETLIDGVHLENCANVFQAYTKPSSWQSFAEQQRHQGTFDVTFDLTADTMTFTGDISEPDVDDGAHVELFGTLPTGLSTSRIYHLVNVSGATCQLADDEGGTPIALSGSYSGVTLVFRPRNIRIVDNLTIRNVKGINMRNNEDAARVSNLYSSGMYWSKGQIQCGTVTLQDWDLDGANQIMVNEGQDVRLINVKMRNARPVGDTPDAATNYAFVLRQYTGGTTAGTLERQANVIMRGCTVEGSTGGGVRANAVTNLTIEDLDVNGFTGSSGGHGDTRVGLVVGRGGLRSGSVYLERIKVRNGTVSGCTNFYYDDASATEDYSLHFGAFDFAGLSGVSYTPATVLIQTAQSRAALQNKRQVYFNDSFDTAAAATLTKLIYGRLGMYAQVIACSIRNPDAATGTSSNHSKVTLVNSTAGTPTNITNGSILIDYAASGIAADSERNMSLIGNDAGGTIAPGSTLKAVVAAGSGSSVAPPFLLNIALFEYTSV